MRDMLLYYITDNQHWNANSGTSAPRWKVGYATHSTHAAVRFGSPALEDMSESCPALWVFLHIERLQKEAIVRVTLPSVDERSEQLVGMRHSEGFRILLKELVKKKSWWA
ncbi:hypothetical protein SeMB42_g01874 [Synchytrium endobioticum]|uniref:Uncharacterized protein n=1 Tax=Synchytrium endobioticum TaxID=286115 RepID=A0A507DIW7_9FUNG|nr:hypothetical protein SeMB42_g01874 [Synchytrium endobioticum]